MRRQLRSHRTRPAGFSRSLALVAVTALGAVAVAALFAAPGRVTTPAGAGERLATSEVEAVSPALVAPATPLPTTVRPCAESEATLGTEASAGPGVAGAIGVSGETGEAGAPVALPRAADLVERPLEELSAKAVDFLATREGPVGVAVAVPGRGAIYTANGDEAFPMASVAKVAIMLTLMDQAIEEERELTAGELSLLDPMIRVSDNDAANALWYAIGEGEAVARYLASIGLPSIVPSPDDCWGTSRAPAREVALLLAKLAGGEILDDTMREVALDLMNGVSPAQRWGVTAGVPADPPPGTVIGIKDGWYPGCNGWWVNSAGAILPGDEHRAYTIAVLTRLQPSFEYGIETIEGVAAHLHAALHGPVSP